MSTQAPAFQFYPKDFLASSKVQRMSLAEVGAYTLLLSHAWLDGSLPPDLPTLARLCRCSTPAFTRMWRAVLYECFQAREDGRLTNKRLEEVRAAQEAFRRGQAEKSRESWEKRRRATDEPMASHRPATGEPQGSLCSSTATASSSASSTPSASPSGVVHTPPKPPRRAPLVTTEHRTHAHCGRVCLPAFLFSEFVRRRNHADADREVRDWAMTVEREWSGTGPRAGDEPGEPLAFWRSRYEEHWPAAKKAPPAFGITSKTAGNLAAAQAWLAEQRTGGAKTWP